MCDSPPGSVAVSDTSIQLVSTALRSSGGGNGNEIETPVPEAHGWVCWSCRRRTVQVSVGLGDWGSVAWPVTVTVWPTAKVVSFGGESMNAVGGELPAEMSTVDGADTPPRLSVTRSYAVQLPAA